MFFSFLFIFLQKNVFLYFLFSGISTRVDCFLSSRCSMEMWCPDDTGRDSWDWGRLRGREHDSTLHGGSSPVKTERPQTVLLLLLFIQFCARMTPIPLLTRHEPWMITLLAQGHSSHDGHPWVKTAQATLFVTKDGCTQDVTKCARATDSRVCTHQRARRGSVLLLLLLLFRTHMKVCVCAQHPQTCMHLQAN